MAKLEEAAIEALREIGNTMDNLKDDLAYARKKLAHMKSTSGKKKVEKSDGPIQVLVGIQVKRIFNVDTVAQTFGAQVCVKMMWKVPPTEELPEPGEAWEPQWVPKFRFRNIMGENGAFQHFAIVSRQGESGEEQWIQAEWDRLVDIYETLELQSFPVDMQDLCIQIVAKDPVERVLFVPWPKSEHSEKPPVVLETGNVALNDFSLMKKTPITYSYVKLEQDHTFCSIVANVKVSRKAFYYLLNVAGVMMVIASFILCAWATHPADLGSRHGIDFTLVLTAVTFKIVLSSMLPKVSYLTLLDYYVMGGFAFLVAVTLCHTFLQANYVPLIDNSPLTMPPNDFEGEQDLIDEDAMTFWIFVGVWAVFNVIWYGYVFVHSKAIYSKFEREAIEYQAKANEEIEKVRPTE